MVGAISCQRHLSHPGSDKSHVDRASGATVNVYSVAKKWIGTCGVSRHFN